MPSPSRSTRVLAQGAAKARPLLCLSAAPAGADSPHVLCSTPFPSLTQPHEFSLSLCVLHSTWDTAVARFAARGYGGLVVSLPPDLGAADAAADYLETVRDTHGMVPPVLVASGVAAFVAQKFLESYSLARLAVVDPVPPHTFGPALARLKAHGPSPAEACLIDAMLQDADAAVVRLESGAVPMLVVTTPGPVRATADDVAVICAFHGIPPANIVAAPSGDEDVVADIILQWVDEDA